jgi:hypothetical protein
MLANARLTIPTLLRTFWRKIGVTWFLTLIETALLALIPLFIGFAIDGLLRSEIDELLNLGSVLIALVIFSVIRRVYDTRVYGTIRVELGQELTARSNELPVSKLNARLNMGRELANFLEEEVPQVMTSAVQLVISLLVLYSFHSTLSFLALGAAVSMILVYAVFHRRFYKLNAEINKQTEKQVGILAARKPRGIFAHLTRLRRIEVKLSDTESLVYGLIYILLLGFVVFNLWFASTAIENTAGTIFSIVSYSWEFVQTAVVLPITLQGWSRLSEITQRINSAE